MKPKVLEDRSRVRRRRLKAGGLKPPAGRTAVDKVVEDLGAALPTSRSSRVSSADGSAGFIPARSRQDGSALGYRTLQEILSQKLRDEILRGRPVAGSRLSIMALARRFGVSSIPVREALRGLEAEGLVEFVANKGVAVKLPSPEELREMLLIRLPLERLALAEAIPKMTDRDLDRLDATLSLMNDASDMGRWLELNQRFHFETYEPAELPRLQMIVTGLWSGTRPYVALYVADARNLRKWQREHVELVRAIRARDVPRSLRILEQHSVATRDAVLGALANSKKGASDAELARARKLPVTALPSDLVITRPARTRH